MKESDIKMAIHMSLRLAWHENGWNGHICVNPESNTYCVGLNSYPGDTIAKSRNLQWEKLHCGKSFCGLKEIPACALSANAFGKEPIIAHNDPPEWLESLGTKGIDIHLPPMTACTWGFENMYDDEVTSSASTGRKYNNDVRFEKTKKYFAAFEEKKSLVFYYVGYSNPFSEGENKNYVVVGVSRIKKLGDYYFYENPSDRIKANYAGGLVWQKPVTSCYPDEGLRIPYEKYKDNEEILEQILFIPDNTYNFKFGSRQMSDDDAIHSIGRFIEIVEVLISIGDTTENWNLRKEWLNTLLTELWNERGAFPGYTKILPILGFQKETSEFIKSSPQIKEEKINSISSFLREDSESITNSDYSKDELKSIRRKFLLFSDLEQKMLLDIFPRFDLNTKQMENILSDDRTNFSIYATLEQIYKNPYLICEQYIGTDSDDNIPFYRIDNGILSSPEFGLPEIMKRDSAERLRALCVAELHKIPAHTFATIESILLSINKKLNAMPIWKKNTYVLKNFTVDYQILSESLFIKKEDDAPKYLYLREVYDDERIIEETLKSLAERNDIGVRIPITHKTFFDELYKSGELKENSQKEYEEAIQGQAAICQQIFTKPISVISGAAGTGKTTVINAIINSISRVHGDGTSFMLMAPTGKATERIKNQTQKGSTTIHSFLAKGGWINANLTLKQIGGKKVSDVSTIIIDECSMIDLTLFATLIRAIKWSSVQRLILVGDPNQLPPVGRGKVFSDIIEWLNKEFPDRVGILKSNLRQLSNRVSNSGTGILELAQIFIQEKQREKQENKLDKEKIFSRVQYSGEIDKDLRVLYWKTPEELERHLSETMLLDMEKATGESQESGKEYLLWDKACKCNGTYRQADYIQVISPYRGEQYGAEHLNVFLQKLLNSAWIKKFEIDGITIGDKVIQYRNRPQSKPTYAYDFEKNSYVRAAIYNGEIGFVRPHEFDMKCVQKMNRLERFQVCFSDSSRKNLGYCYGKNLGDMNKKAIFEQKPVDNLELAYVISVHKSQGSEFKHVYVIIPKRDSHLLSMELVYTAITRAQKHLTVLVQDDISTLTSLSRVEKSATQKINSSIFSFNPLPQDIVYMGSWYEEGKIISTLSEYFVRSKSEMNIANILTLKEIDFKYEIPLFAPNGTMFLPDFTINWHGEEYYWEHVGRLDLPEYKKHWEEKEKWYNEFFPAKLIVTYEGNDQSKEIEKTIDLFFS